LKVLEKDLGKVFVAQLPAVRGLKNDVQALLENADDTGLTDFLKEHLATEWPLRNLDGILLEFQWNFREWEMEFQKYCMHF
jgi:hypothetical protein